MDLVTQARQFDFVREIGGPNKGKWVEIFQHFTGNQPPDSWCASFVSFVIALVTKGTTTLPRSAACQDYYDYAKHNGLLLHLPEVGCLFLYVNDQDHAHHIGIVTQLEPLMGIAGNTSSDGSSSNGDGVYENAIQAVVFIKTGL